MSDFRNNLKVKNINWLPGQDIRNVDLRELMKQAMGITGIINIGVFLVFVLFKSDLINNVVPISLAITVTNFIIYILVTYKEIAYKYYLPIYSYFVTIPNLFILIVLLNYINDVSQRNLYFMMYCGLFVIGNLFYSLYEINKATNKYFIVILGISLVPLMRINYFLEVFSVMTIVYYILSILSIYYFHLLRYATKELRKVNK